MKKNLHFFTTLLLVVFLTNSLHAQLASIQKLVIIPENPGANDYVSVVSQTMFTSGGCRLKSYSVSETGNTINILADHTVGVLTVICYSADTIPVGKFSSGAFEIIYSLAANSVTRDIDTIGFTVRQFAGIDSKTGPETKMDIYPNPATHIITISGGGSLPGETSVGIFNMGGQQRIHSAFQNRQRIEMDVSSLPKGVYLVKIQSKTGTLVKKLVIQ